MSEPQLPLNFGVYGAYNAYPAMDPRFQNAQVQMYQQPMYSQNTALPMGSMVPQGSMIPQESTVHDSAIKEYSPVQIPAKFQLSEIVPSAIKMKDIKSSVKQTDKGAITQHIISLAYEIRITNNPAPISKYLKFEIRKVETTKGITISMPKGPDGKPSRERPTVAAVLDSPKKIMTFKIVNLNDMQKLLQMRERVANILVEIGDKIGVRSRVASSVLDQGNFYGFFLYETPKGGDHMSLPVEGKPMYLYASVTDRQDFKTRIQVPSSSGLRVINRADWCNFVNKPMECSVVLSMNAVLVSSACIKIYCNIDSVFIHKFLPVESSAMQQDTYEEYLRENAGAVDEYERSLSSVIDCSPSTPIPTLPSPSQVSTVSTSLAGLMTNS